MQEPLLSFSSPPEAQVLSHFLSSSFSLLLFGPIWLCGNLSCPFKCLRSSAHVQLVLCENCFMCRYILDAFMGRDELHVLLLLHHLDSSPKVFEIRINR